MICPVALQPSQPIHAQEIAASLHAQITERSIRLTALAADLKAELFGIDDVIDRVIESMRAWYVLPDLINRPVIICLWGLTGTGKNAVDPVHCPKAGVVSPKPDFFSVNVKLT
jgi:hypothetical protein